MLTLCYFILVLQYATLIVWLSVAFLFQCLNLDHSCLTLGFFASSGSFYDKREKGWREERGNRDQKKRKLGPQQAGVHTTKTSINIYIYIHIRLLHLHITSLDSSSQKRSRNREERKEMESVGNVERREKGKRSRMAKEGTTEHGYELNRNESPQTQFIVILVICYYLQLFNLNWG